MEESKLNRFAHWLGPYDYNYPLIFAAIVTLYSSQTRVYSYAYNFGSARTEFMMKSLIMNIFFGLIVVSLFRFATLFRRSEFISLWKYFAEIFLVMCGVSSAIYIFNTAIRQRVGLTRTWGPDDTFLTFTSKLFFAILFIAFTHSGIRTVRLRLNRASELIEELQGKYRSLVESDEEIRGQASRYIHDRVQAEITIVSTRLSKVALNEGHDLKSTLQPIVADLEKIRSIDLKMVSQILTPNIAAEGLDGAIETLCNQYKGGVEYIFNLDSSIRECNDDISLGIFRIVEQGVINSITHGPASRIAIKFERTLLDTYLVEVSDNGPGAIDIKPGKGSVIIDAWCSILGGVKEIENRPNYGFVLRVTIPVTKQ